MSRVALYHRSQPAWKVALGLVVLCASLTAVAEERSDADHLPNPGEHGSHEAFKRVLDDSRIATYQRIIAGYDAWLRDHPGELTAAIERCRFILASSSSYDDDDDAITQLMLDYDGDEGCAVQLLKQHPTAPEALLFAIEHTWGERGIELGLATLQRSDVPWPPAMRASFLGHLAHRYDQQGKPRQALAWAIHARDGDSLVDVSLILATHLKNAGRRDEAIAELVRAPSDPVYVNRKLELLIELAAYGEALAVRDNAGPEAVVLPLLHAKVLEGVGQTDAARATYGELTEQYWNREEVLRRLFYIDLERRDRDRAVASYEALRAEGYMADPMLRHRLALAAVHPTARWHVRDVLGLLGLVALLLFAALSPGIFVVPLHYVGLLRGTYPAEGGVSAYRWSLRHLWAIAATFFVAQTLALYICAYDRLHAEVFDVELGMPVADAAPARLLVVSTLSCFVLVGAYYRRGDFARFVRSAWGAREMLRRVFGALVIVMIVERVCRYATRAVASDSDLIGLLGSSWTQDAAIRAGLVVHGPWLVYLLIVVCVPLYEEFVFRGAFLGAATRCLPFRWANVVQAVAFMLVHDDWTRWGGIFAVALVAGALVRRSGGLMPAIALHAALNFVAVTFIYIREPVATQKIMNGREHYDSPPVSPIPGRREAQLAKDCDTGWTAACHELARLHAHASTRLWNGDGSELPLGSLSPAVAP